MTAPTKRCPCEGAIEYSLSPRSVYNRVRSEKGSTAMCIEIVTPDGTWCDTIAELRAATGRVVPIKGGYAKAVGRDGNCCLCPVDVKRLAKRQGWRINSWTTPMTYYAIKGKQRADARAIELEAEWLAKHTAAIAANKTRASSKSTES